MLSFDHLSYFEFDFVLIETRKCGGHYEKSIDSHINDCLEQRGAGGNKLTITFISEDGSTCAIESGYSVKVQSSGFSVYGYNWYDSHLVTINDVVQSYRKSQN